MILIDTSAAIDLLKGNEKGLKIKQYIESDVIATSTITINEVLIGAEGPQKPVVHDFIKTLQIFPFDTAAAYKSVGVEESLMKKGKPIGKLDIFIASICLVHDVKLLTTDKDFMHVTGLKAVVV